MLQQEFQIIVNVQAVGFCHFNHSVNSGTGLGTFGGITEQPIFTTDREWTDRIFGSLSEYSHNAPNGALSRL